MADTEGSDENAAAAHREKSAVAGVVETRRDIVRLFAERGASEPPDVGARQPFLEDARLGPRHGIVLEEEERAGHDVHSGLDALDDRMGELFAGSRRREIA